MNRKGQALVEFVLILPLFILIMFAIIDFGIIMSRKSELENTVIDIVMMINNNDDIEMIRNSYPSLVIDTVKEGKYTTIKVSSKVDIITPGLNLVLGDPYIVTVERVVMNA